MCCLGYTRQIFGGHTTVPTDPVKPGYHGEEGYRKNTPDLRRQQSVFDYEGTFSMSVQYTVVKVVYLWVYFVIIIMKIYLHIQTPLTILGR